jgi:hypothetical protein
MTTDISDTHERGGGLTHRPFTLGVNLDVELDTLVLSRWSF